MDLPGHGFAAKGAGLACSVPAYRDFLGGFLDAAGIARDYRRHLARRPCRRLLGRREPGRVDGIVLSGSMGLVPIGDEARARVQAGANNQTREGVGGSCSG